MTIGWGDLSQRRAIRRVAGVECLCWLALLMLVYKAGVSPLALEGCIALVLALVGCFVVCAAVYDAYTCRLPHILTLPAAFIAIVGMRLIIGWSDSITGSLGGFFVIKGTQWLCRWRQKRECLGSGDAFLMLSLGALLGPTLLPWGIALAILLALAFIRLYPFQKNHRIPFGPFLVTACLPLALVGAICSG